MQAKSGKARSQFLFQNRAYLSLALELKLKNFGCNHSFPVLGLACNQSLLPTDAKTGKVRETFALNQLQNAKLPVTDSAQGEFSVNHYTLEIGSKNKTKKQIKNLANSFIFADHIVTGEANKIPLYLLGFLSWPINQVAFQPKTCGFLS